MAQTIFGRLADRLRVRVQRAQNLQPIATQVEQVLTDHNRNMVLRALDGRGRLVAPLKKSTIRRRGHSGKPRAPHGRQSRIITRFRVLRIIESIGPTGEITSIRFRATWPGVRWMIHHIRGTRHMARRNPQGFTAEVLRQIRTILRNHVMK